MKTGIIIISIFSCCLLFDQKSAAQSPVITKLSMKIIAEATVNKVEKVYVHIAAKEARAVKVAGRVSQLSGEINFIDTTVDYIRAMVPVARLYDLAKDTDILVMQVIDLSTTLQVGGALMTEAVGAGEEGPAAGPGKPERSSGDMPPGALDYPFGSAYHPWQDVDAADLLKQNSHYDGRGVTTGFVEWLPNLTMPEMKYSYDINGKVINKVTDIVFNIGKEPIPTARSTWYHFDSGFTSHGRRLVYKDTSYTVPYDGTFMLCRSPDKSEGRKGAIHLTGPFTILWDKEKGSIWIDHDHDHNFSDEKRLRLYSIDQDVDTAGFVLLKIDDEANRVFLTSTDYGQHTPMVFASIAANKTAKGLFNGMAPGAAEIAYLPYSSEAGLESIVRSFRDPRVEIIGSDNAVNFNITQASAQEISSGATVQDIIVNRCIRRYNKLLVKGAANDDGLGNVDHMCSDNILAVGAYHSRENYRVNNLAVQPVENDLHWYSSWGPNEAGEIKPDILAPSQWITYYYSKPLYDPDWYNFPPGYNLGGGTSQACPTAEGGLALIMSACKQSHIPYDYRSLKWAVTSTARFMPELTAVQQGNGLLQVNTAFLLLRQLAFGSKQGGYGLEVETKAGVNTENSHLLPVPFEGKGIFEKIGWTPGQSGTRTIRLLRRKGPSTPVRCHVGWLGNASAVFSCDTIISLPLGKEVLLPVSIGPLKPGVSSALIRISGDRYLGDIAKIMVCIVAAEPVGGNYTITKEVEVPRPNGKVAAYYAISDSIYGFGITYHTALPDVLSVMTVRDAVALYNRNSRYLNGRDKNKETFCDNPEKGTFEILLHDRRDQSHLDLRNAGKPLPPVKQSYTLSLYGVKESGYIGGVTDGLVKKFSFTNRYAAFNGQMASNALGSLHRQTDSLAPDGFRIYEVQVDSGSTQLSVYYKTRSADADLDLYILAPQNKEGKTIWKTKEWDYGYRQSSFIEIPRPAPGVWKIAVMNCSKRVAYDYFDLVLHPKYGSFMSTDDVKKHPLLDQWQPEGKVWVNPTGGVALEHGAVSRRPAALVKVVATDGEPVTIGWQLYEIK